jgi:hypothetical protein
MRHNQSRAGDLGIAERFEARRIVGAFLAMAKHLRSRPEPRAQFDEVACGRATTPGWALVRAARVCLSAAQEKDAATLEATRAEVSRFYDTLKEASLRGYEPRECSAEDAIVQLAREQSEVEAAVVRFTVQRDPASREQFMREVSEVIPAATRVLSLGSRLSLPSHPLPMGAVRN